MPFRSSRPVLLVSLSARFGGADVRVMQMARALKEERPYAVATLTDSPLYAKLRAEGLEAIPCGRSRANPLLLWKLFRVIRRGGFAVVDAHQPQSQFWGLAAAVVAGVRIRLSTVHSIYGKADAGALHQALYRGVLLLNRLWRCRFIVVSRETFEHLRSMGIAADRIRLIANGVEEVISLEPSPLRDELGWSPELSVIGIFGRLSPIKGHHLLFEAIRQICASVPNVRCLVVGDGAMFAELERAVHSLELGEIVRFTGFRSDVLPLMQSCDIICQPSLSEGLPFSVLEAAALGKPLVLSAVGALPDHFRHRETACFVPPGDAEALARELEWCLHHRDSAAEIGQSARALVRSRFSIGKMLAETYEAYDEDSSRPKPV